MRDELPRPWGWAVWYWEPLGASPEHFGHAGHAAWRCLVTMFCLGRRPWLEYTECNEGNLRDK